MNYLYWKAGLHVRKCIWLCFRHVTKFLMLIWQTAFVFHKSKQAKTKATSKKLSTKINSTEVSFCSNEWFYRAVVTGQIQFRPHESCPTIQAARNLPEQIKHESVFTATQALRVRIAMRENIPFSIGFFPLLKSIPCLYLFTLLQT